MLNSWYFELTANFKGKIAFIEHCEMLLETGKVNVLRFDSRLTNTP